MKVNNLTKVLSIVAVAASTCMFGSGDHDKYDKYDRKSHCHYQEAKWAASGDGHNQQEGKWNAYGSGKQYNMEFQKDANVDGPVVQGDGNSVRKGDTSVSTSVRLW